LNVISQKQIGHFTLQQISKKHYRIIYTEKANNAILMTGAAVTKAIKIDFTFVLKSIKLNHFTSTLGTASSDNLAITLRRPKVHGVDKFVDDFYDKDYLNPTNGRITISFEDIGDEGGLIFESSIIDLILNTTDTDLVQPIIYIKRLD